MTYLSVSGKPGDKVTGTATCEKSKRTSTLYPSPSLHPLSNLGVTGANAVIVGKTLAYTLVQFWNEKGQLSARGSHTK